MSNIWRIRLLSFLVITVAALILARLFYVQIIHGAEYSENADHQYAVPSSNIFERGSISFTKRGGELISAATLKNGYFLAINPKEMKDKEEAFNKLSSVITIDHDAFMAKAGKENDPYEEITHRLSKEEADKITAFKIPGISLYQEKWRFYPAGTVASQVLGFIGYKGNDYTGRYGLERYYNDTLSRVDNELYVNFFAEVFANLKSSIFTESGRREGDIVITIDPAIQSTLEKELAVLEEKYHSKFSGGIIINPKDGSIYAIANNPTFDPNKYQEADDVSVYANHMVEDSYEMGSIVKPLTMAAALDDGAVTAKTTYNDTGSLTLNNKTIYNFDKKPRGVVDMQEVLNQSLNLGAVFAMQKLGKDKFREYFLAYGMGDKTGIDLPNEARSQITNLSNNRDIEFANASFGQGLAVSPIVMARALSALANGGYLITPHVVQRTEYKGGLSDIPKYPPGSRVIKRETSSEITRMLVNVVDKALMGGTVKMEHYSIAAKTGTAQLEKEGGGYYDDRFRHTFFGYFPAYNPAFLIFLFTENPQGEMYASHTLTEPFINMAKFLINYYELPPDR